MFVLAVLAGCVGFGRGAAEPGLLEGVRERIESFRTVFVSIGSRGSDHPEAVLRMERSTGRIVLDQFGGDRRTSWDGETLWKDVSPTLPAGRVGPEADAVVAQVLGEVLGGLDNSDLVLDQRCARMPWGVFVDLPFAWDDPYWVCFVTKATDAVKAMEIRHRDTARPADLAHWLTPGPLWVSVEWDVRLFPDLDERESIRSRSEVVVYDDGWSQGWEGPPYFPGWHQLTTRNPMVLDPAMSLADPPFEGRPNTAEVHLEHVTCRAAGQIQRPFTLVYRLDPIDPSFDFFSEAAAAGCPLSVEGAYVHEHR